MTINLHAKTEFEKGDLGRVTGHTAIKIDAVEPGVSYVVALQYVRAGTNGWFETRG